MSGHGNRDLSGLVFRLNLGSYQFSTTTKEPVRVDDNDVIYYFGSGTEVRYPSKIDTSLKVTPIGSTIQRPLENDSWKYTSNPNDNCGEERINTVYNVILPYKNGYLEAGAAPDQAFLKLPRYKVVDREESLSTYKITEGLFYQAPFGNGIGLLGSKMPMLPTTSVKFEEDFKEIKKECKSFPLSITTDYIQQAWITNSSNHFGSRTFIIFNTMSGSFYCFPINVPLENGVVPVSAIKSVTPNYPEWVASSVNVKDYYDSNGHFPLDPIISWSIDSTGKKAIACCVERTTFSGNLNNLQLISNAPSPEDLATEVVMGSVNVFAEKAFFGSGDSEPMMIDRIGVVGLDFSIDLTGNEFYQYSFNVDVSRNQPPVDTNPIRVGIAYSKEILDWAVEADSIVELFMEFYCTEEQLKFNSALDGIYGSESPQYGRWIIKVNGTILHSFPMQSILDSENNLIPFSCLKHLVTATTIYTELENLDLSTCSFYRTTRIRKPVLERNVERITQGAWIGSINQLRKKCAVRTDAFVFGELIETKTCGDTDLISFLENYFTIDYHNAKSGSATLLTPDQKFNLRANYRSFLTKPTVTGSTDIERGLLGPQWWAHVIHWPFWYVFIEMAHKEQFGDYDPDTAETGCNSNFLPLSQINEDNFSEEFFEKVLNYDHNQGDVIANSLGTIWCGETGSTYNWSTSAMLNAANPSGYSLNDIKWLLWKIFQLARDIFPNNYTPLLKTEGEEQYYELFYGADRYIPSLAMAYYHSSDGQFVNSKEPLILIDPGREVSYNDHFIIREYPWVWHWVAKNYNQLIVDKGRNNIMTHPNGHYSLMHDYVYCPTGEEPEGEFYAYTISTGAENHEDNPFSDYRTGFYHSEHPPISEQNGFFIDKVSFWNGILETDHVALHNQAFNRTETLSEYNPTVTQLYSEYTEDEQTPVIIYGGFRYTTHLFNNPFMKFDLLGTATELRKEKVALAYPRIAPLWGC